MTLAQKKAALELVRTMAASEWASPKIRDALFKVLERARFVQADDLQILLRMLLEREAGGGSVRDVFDAAFGTLYWSRRAERFAW